MTTDSEEILRAEIERSRALARSLRADADDLDHAASYWEGSPTTGGKTADRGGCAT